MTKVSVVPGSFRMTGEKYWPADGDEPICEAELCLLIDGVERKARVLLKERTWDLTEILQVTKNAMSKGGTSLRPFQFKGNVNYTIRRAVVETVQTAKKEFRNGSDESRVKVG